MGNAEYMGTGDGARESEEGDAGHEDRRGGKELKRPRRARSACNFSLILSKGEPPRRSIPGSERCLPDQGLGSPVESRARPFEVGTFPQIDSPPLGCFTSNSWQQWGHSCARVGAECMISGPPLRQGRLACNLDLSFSD